MTGKQFKDFRESLELSQTDLAKWMGIHGNTIYRYESGKMDIPLMVELALEGVKVRIKQNKIEEAKRILSENNEQ